MRGSLGTIIGNMYTLGSLYTYTTSYFLSSWRTVAWLQLVPCAALGLSVCFIPNSPFWLVERGREEEARASLQILRGPHYCVEAELGQIVNKKKAKEAVGRSVLKTLASRVFLLPFIRLGALMAISQWAGINVIISYMVSIFQDSGSRWCSSPLLDPALPAWTLS